MSRSSIDLAGVPDDCRLIDLAAVAAMTGMHRRTIEKLYAQGLFPKPVRIGRARRWRLADVVAFIRNLKGS